MLEVKNKNIKKNQNKKSYDINNFSFLKSQVLLKDLNTSLSSELLKERRTAK